MSENRKRTLALVLRTIEVFETSLVVTLFTRELGKVARWPRGRGGRSRGSRVALTSWGFPISC